jgi:hypothetical protein
MERISIRRLGCQLVQVVGGNVIFKTDLGNWSPPHGHNLVVDALVKSGLLGLCILALVLWAAIRSTRAIEVSSHQIACFGYLIAFLVISATEAIWIPPTLQLFPVVGLVFAVVIFSRYDVQATEEPAVTAHLSPELSPPSKIVHVGGARRAVRQIFAQRIRRDSPDEMGPDA